MTKKLIMFSLLVVTTVACRNDAEQQLRNNCQNGSQNERCVDIKIDSTDPVTVKRDAISRIILTTNRPFNNWRSFDGSTWQEDFIYDEVFSVKLLKEGGAELNIPLDRVLLSVMLGQKKSDFEPKPNLLDITILPEDVAQFPSFENLFLEVSLHDLKGEVTISKIPVIVISM